MQKIGVLVIAAKKTDAVTADDKKKTETAPVSAAGESKTDDGSLKKRNVNK